MPHWITTKEAAEIAGYSLDHLRVLIRGGRIKGQKFGAVWQVDSQSLLTHLRNSQQLGARRGAKPKRHP